jgi:hypothetical protein
MTAWYRTSLAGRWRAVALSGLLLALGLNACAEPELDDDTDEVAEEEGDATPTPEQQELLDQLALVVSSVEVARGHLVEASAADDVEVAREAGTSAVAQLLADGRAPTDAPPALLPVETPDRTQTRAHPDAFTPALTAARRAGGTLGDRAIGVLRDPIAGDVAAWERDAAGMVEQIEDVATAGRTIEQLDAEILELSGDGSRAAAWALLTATASDLDQAQTFAERGLVHLDLIIQSMESKLGDALDVPTGEAP